MRLQVSCEDRLGLTRELLMRLEEHAIDLRGIELDEAGGFIYLHFPDLGFERLQQLMPEIRRIRGILDVKTVPFMPSEREHHQLQTLMKALPDLIFTLDLRGRIRHANEAVLNILRLELKDVFGLQAGSFLKGFAFSHWLQEGARQRERCKLGFAGEDYLADILPVSVPRMPGLVDAETLALAGALVILKSARRGGHPFHPAQREDDSRFELFTAQSPAMQAMLHQARRLAMQDLPLLIQGETGSGKEMLARACHRGSLRAQGPLLALNCAALPDEVAEMSPLLQSKLLRVLQDGRFHRVGQTEQVRVDVRILCLSRQSLEERVRQGLFAGQQGGRNQLLALDRRFVAQQGVAGFHRFLRQHVRALRHGGGDQRIRFPQALAHLGRAVNADDEELLAPGLTCGLLDTQRRRVIDGKDGVDVRVNGEQVGHARKSAFGGAAAVAVGR